MIHKKTNPPNFFSLQIRKLAASLEGLNSSLVQLTEELWSWKVTRIQVAHTGQWKQPGVEGVKHYSASKWTSSF